MRSIGYIYNKTVLVLLKQIVKPIAWLWPRDKKLIAIGAWMGKSYGDNPRYLTEYLLENSDLRIVWIGNYLVREKLPVSPRLQFRLKGSLNAALSLLRAGVWVCCISIEWDLTTWPLEGRAKLINTWHGYSIKQGGNKMGNVASRKASFFGFLVRRLTLHKKPWVTVGSERDVEKLLRCDKDYFSADRIYRIGTPTNDYLICNQANETLKDCLRKKYSELFGFNPEVRIITYLPTFRKEGKKVFSFYGLDKDHQKAWREMLSSNKAVIIEKHHPRTLEEFPTVGASICSLPISADKQRYVDVYELLLITDILITDYSGAGQDFGVMKRPCLNFMYDLEDYLFNCSGLLDGWEDMVPGPLVKTEEELFKAVADNLNAPCFEPAAGYARTCEYQTGHSCEKLLEFIKK